MSDFLRTDDVAEADRFAQWRHWISATFVPLECAQVGRAPFRGEVGHWDLGEMLVSRVAADPHLASRSRRMIAVRDAGYYKVGLLTRGSCRLTQVGREALLRPGDLAIYDCRRPYTMVFPEAHEMSFLMFPCDRLRLPPAAVDEVLVTPVSSAESTASLVAPFLRQLVANLEHSRRPVNGRLADNALDLLATLFGERAGAAPTDPGTVRRSLLLNVHAWIDAHLADIDLDPVTIAAANHISVRYLHKLFHDEGTSVARWVRERRLDNCRRDLEDPALAQRGVQAIARRWGFADAAHFSRIFKASFGEPPGQYRRRGDLAGRR
ncbi:MAG TPA: helix-turn-helix domain-containing protein [Streptosporangiaceae bacterium]